MSSLIPGAGPFAYLHATDVGSRLQKIAEAIAADSFANDLLTPADGVVVRCSADASIHQNQKGKPRLYEFYWSVQRQSESGFTARTLSYSRKADAMQWLDFPADPDLPQLQEFLSQANGVRVLRYVPQRRLTIRLDTPDGVGVVGKFKRASRIGDAIGKLRMVNSLTAAAKLPFSVPAFLGTTKEGVMFLQSLCPGQSLATVMTRKNTSELLAKAAQLLAQLHTVPATNLEHQSNRDVLAEAHQAADWLAMLLPEHGAELAHCTATLAARMPPDDPPVFCHGDFVCSQMLVDPARWSLLDFDLCRIGSRYRDIAILLASLPSDVDCYSAGETAEADETFIAAYKTHQAIDRLALTWHRICAELHYLMLMVKKDRYRSTSFESSLRQIAIRCHALKGR